MNISIELGLVVTLVVGLGLIGGGLVLFAGSRRTGWRAIGMSAVAAGVGFLLALTLAVPTSREGDAPAPVVGYAVVADPPSNGGPTTSADPGRPAIAGSMIPRPRTVEELVAGADVIIMGTIDSVLEERIMGGYGDEGRALPAGEGGLPYTDYEVNIESLLKVDDRISAETGLVLRMFGHLSNKNAAITLNSFTPTPGDRLLLALGRNPDGTYGSGPEGLLDIEGERVTYADGLPFAAGISPDQLMRDITKTVSGSETQAASARRATSSPEPSIVFLRQEEVVGDRVVMEAQFVDELVVENGCLRIGRSDIGTSYLPVWPHRYRLSIDADQVVVYDWRAGEEVGRVGQEIRVSGGGVHSAERLDPSIQRVLTGNCAGPFWIVGDEAGVVQAAEDSPAPANALEGTPLAPSAPPSHGTPPPPAASPQPSLKFEGVEYVYTGHAELSTKEALAFVIDGAEVHISDLEVVGRTTEGNTPGIQDGLQVYRHKGRETNEIYTFRQVEDYVNPEDGQIFKGRDGWTYWTVAKLTETGQSG